MEMATKSPAATPRRKAAWLFLTLFLFLAPATARGQSGVSRTPLQAPSAEQGWAQQRAAHGVRPGDLDKWMYSRAAWVAILGGMAGFLLSWFHLTKLPYREQMETERQARSIFLVTLVFIMLPVVLLALFTDMYLYAFSGQPAFNLLGALFGTQGLLLTAAALFTFTLVSFGVTWRKPGSRCPYMLRPRPKVQ